MARALEMFPRPPRKNPRVMMRVTDAGLSPGGDHIATFECARCGAKTGWLVCGGVTDVRRGEPCPQCNREAA